ncbi:MAG: type ISP restriction/modification enzyme [Mucilaginibacter sp.]
MESVPQEDLFSIDFNEGDGISALTGPDSLLLYAVNKLDKKVTNKIEVTLGLAFVNDNEATGEVCYANEPGLRPEFRQSFTGTDLINYIYAVLYSPGNSKKYAEFLKTGVAEIPYPTNVDYFWMMVQTGSCLR